jgi:hypothetical protein
MIPEPLPLTEPRPSGSGWPATLDFPVSGGRQPVRKYAIVIEKGENDLSAYVPDLPGCITTGRTTDEIERNIREAIALHLEGIAGRW